MDRFGRDDWGAMLTVDCPRCGITLASASMIRALVHSPLGIEMEIACPCGERIHHLTGRRLLDRDGRKREIRHLDPTRP